MTYSSPSESGLSKASVEKLAASIAHQVGYEPGGDLASIVKKLGGRVVVSDVWDEIRRRVWIYTN